MPWSWRGKPRNPKVNPRAHSRGSGDPGPSSRLLPWIPAFAGMTEEGRPAHRGFYRVVGDDPATTRSLLPLARSCASRSVPMKETAKSAARRNLARTLAEAEICSNDYHGARLGYFGTLLPCKAAFIMAENLKQI